MRLGSDRLSLLLAHGFQESEARVYLTLIDHPSMTASTLAKAARVPRSYLYNVIQDLHTRGLVDIIMTEGKRSYRARPFEQFLARQAEALREKLVDVERQRTSLASALQPPPLEPTNVPEAGEVRILMGRRAVAREIEELLYSAKERIVIECSEGGVERVGRHLQSLLALPLPQHRHCEVHVYLPPGAAPEFLGGDVSREHRVRTHAMTSASPALVFIADDARLILVHPIPDSGDLRQGRDFAIVTNDAIFVKSRLHLLREAIPAADMEGSAPQPLGR